SCWAQRSLEPSSLVGLETQRPAEAFQPVPPRYEEPRNPTFLNTRRYSSVPSVSPKWGGKWGGLPMGWGGSLPALWNRKARARRRLESKPAAIHALAGRGARTPEGVGAAVEVSRMPLTGGMKGTRWRDAQPSYCRQAAADEQLLRHSCSDDDARHREARPLRRR